MKKTWILACAAALALSACAPAAPDASAPVSETPVSDATDAVYENIRIFPLDIDDIDDNLQSQIDSEVMLRDSYGGSECRFINLAGTVAEESLGAENGVLTLENAVYDANGVNALPDGAQARIEWNAANDTTRLTFTDASGATLLGLERASNGDTTHAAGTFPITRENQEAVAYYARALIQNRYAAKGVSVPFVIQPVPADASAALSGGEAEEVVRAVLVSVDRIREWERNLSYTLVDLTHPEQGIVAEADYGGTPLRVLYLPSLSFSDEQAYRDAYDRAFLRRAPESEGLPAVLIRDGKVWISSSQGGIGGSYRVDPERVEIVSSEAGRIVADIWETYNDSGVSAIPLVRSRYELTVQDGNWVVDRAASGQDEESYRAADEAWNGWFNEHYAPFYLESGTDADLGALWDALGAGTGAWSGTEEGAWNENATLASPGFAFSVQNGRYCVALYSTLGSGATTYIADGAMTDGAGNYVVTFGSFIGEVADERTYDEGSRPQMWIETGEDGDGRIRIAGQGMDQLDGWAYEYEFTPAS